jgi:hypothetical protein
MNWPDALRYLCFGQAFIIVIFTAVIIARYSFKLALLKRSGQGRDRALPWHIVLIGISYLGLTSYVVMSLREHLGEDLSWRVPTALIFFACGNAAFIFMWAHLSVQRVIVAAVIDKLASKITDDIDELKKHSVAAAVASDKVSATVEQTHAKVEKIEQKIASNGPTNVQIDQPPEKPVPVVIRNPPKA